MKKRKYHLKNESLRNLATKIKTECFSKDLNSAQNFTFFELNFEIAGNAKRQ